MDKETMFKLLETSSMNMSMENYKAIGYQRIIQDNTGNYNLFRHGDHIAEGTIEEMRYKAVMNIKAV